MFLLTRSQAHFTTVSLLNMDLKDLQKYLESPREESCKRHFHFLSSKFISPICVQNHTIHFIIHFPQHKKCASRGSNKRGKFNSRRTERLQQASPAPLAFERVVRRLMDPVMGNLTRTRCVNQFGLKTCLGGTVEKMKA